MGPSAVVLPLWFVRDCMCNGVRERGSVANRKRKEHKGIVYGCRKLLASFPPSALSRISKRLNHVKTHVNDERLGRKPETHLFKKQLSVVVII